MGKERQLCILHTNDTHSYLDELPERAAIIQALRQRNQENGIPTLLLGGGDSYSGTLYFQMYHGVREADLLNKLQYDAMTIGNHDFDKGPKILADFIETLDFPMVTSNVDLVADAALGPLWERGDIKPYLIQKLSDGSRVGIFGLTTETTPNSATPGQDVKFNPAFACAEEMVAKLQAEKVDEIILLSHLGDDVDVELAKAVPGINVIVGAHTHAVLQEAVIVKNEQTGQSTAIVQAGNHGRFLGELTVAFDEQGNLIRAHEELHTMREGQRLDPEWVTLIKQMQAERATIAAEPIAEVKTAINGERAMIKSYQGAMGNLLADAFMWQAKQAGYRPDAAVMNGGGIRTGLPTGQVTFGDVYSILPFGTNLVIVQITGLELWQALEFGGYPQVAGLHLIYNRERERGQQLMQVDIRTVDGWQPLELEKTYLVAANTFVAMGKDAYRGFNTAQIISDKLEDDVEVLSNYLRALPQPIDYYDETRVQLLP